MYAKLEQRLPPIINNKKEALSVFTSQSKTDRENATDGFPAKILIKFLQWHAPL